MSENYMAIFVPAWKVDGGDMLAVRGHSTAFPARIFSRMRRQTI